MAQCRILFAFPYSTTSIAVYKTNIRISRKSCSVMLWLTHFYYVTWTDARISFLSFFSQLTASFNCLRFAFFRLQQLISGALFDVRCRNSEKLQSACDGREMHHFIFCLVAEWWMTNLCFSFFDEKWKFLGAHPNCCILIFLPVK